MSLLPRVFAREKAFAAFATLTLALGIGAAAAMFSVVDGVLLQPLAYGEPSRLYSVDESAPKLSATYPLLPVNAHHFNLWQQQCTACESAALVAPRAFNLTSAGEPERIEGVGCTWRLFETLRIQPQLGRTFVATDDSPDNSRYVVLADSLWRRRFHADPAILGRRIELNGQPHEVVGVLRPDFRFPAGGQVGAILEFPRKAEIFRPLGLNMAKQNPVGSFNFSMLLRLKPGASAQAAQQQMSALIAPVAKQIGMDMFAHLTPLQERVTGSSRRALWLLLAAVGVVLLIVCVNLGNLMLARADGRARDAAVRRALGASRLEILRPIMAESLALSFAGGALGLLVAWAAIRLLAVAAPPDLPRLDEVRLSYSTFGFAVLLSALSGLLCAIWPALRLMSSEPMEAMRSGSRSSTDNHAKLRARQWLVGGEVALSTLLLAVGALLGVSFLQVLRVDRGFQVERILTAEVALPAARYTSDERRATFHRDLLSSLESLPGVRSAALVSSLPLKAQVWGDLITKEGETRPLPERPLAHYRFISPRYFESMGIALEAGRFPTEADRARKVALLSRSAAAATWPGENPIGRRISDNEQKQELVEVIGVVADVRTVSLEEKPAAIVYVPYWDGKYWQGGVWGNATYILRTEREPASLASALRTAVRRMDPQLPVADLLTMREIVSESVGRRQFQTLLAAVFALSALLLACLGIYGVIAYTVSRRTSEIGIRMALGASGRQIASLVVGQGMRPVIAGLGAGLVLSLWAGQALRGLLFGVESSDLPTLAAVAATLLAVGALACWLPARRAARIAPVTALRYE